MTRLPFFLKWPLYGLYALVFAEFFLRLMAPQALMPRYVTGTEYGVRGNIPNAVYRHQTPEIDVTLRINGQGMRADRDFLLKKPPGTCRIALFGDSYFMGYEATLEDSIAGRLEAGLAERGYQAEVLNFAVSGFGTAEMIRTFEAYAAAFSPDIVVYQFHASDFSDNLRAALFRLEPDGTVTPTQQSYLPGISIRDRLMRYDIYRWLIENSHLYTLVREKAGRAVQAMLVTLRGLEQLLTPTPARATSASGSAESMPGARLTSALLRHARYRAEISGADWYVLDIPGPGSKRPVNSLARHLDLDLETASRLVEPSHLLETHAVAGRLIYRQRGHLHLTRLATGWSPRRSSKGWCRTARPALPAAARTGRARRGTQLKGAVRGSGGSAIS